MKRFGSAIALLALLAVGCSHAQVPPSTNSVVLTWTAPAASGSWGGCTAAAPCTYVLSRATVASGTSCPATTGTSYTPIDQSSPAAGTTFTDSAPPSGANVCYSVQTLQGGLYSTASAASNSGTTVAIPVLPLAPSGLNTSSVSENGPAPAAAPKAAPALASAAPTRLSARVAGF
jgi:hypothetical protein